jgi:uncharacterized protein (DUF305 family)
MKKYHYTFAVSCLIVGFLIGMGYGYYLTPEYKAQMYERASMSLGPADRLYDLRYLNAMIAHHRGAVLLAQQLQAHTQRKELQSLAADILKNEPALIKELYMWKKEWYTDTRTVRDMVVPNLGTADETFDLRFLNALIAHHEAGIAMTRETHAKSSRSEILNNANAVEQFLLNGIDMVKSMRKNWYGI